MILTNLMIALMTTEYDKVQAQAKAEVIFNETELTVDLSQRSRMMPPPLNVFVLVIAAVMLVSNLLLVFLCKVGGKNWNIFAVIDHELFNNLKEHNFNFRKWERKEPIPEWRHEYFHDLLQYYKERFCNFCRRRGSSDQRERQQNFLPTQPWSLLHKGCYGMK